MDQQILRTKEYYELEANVRRYGDAVDSVGLWESERAVFAKHADKSARILDVGCGAGRTTFGLFREGYRDIAGLDLSEKLIAYATAYAERHGLGIPFVCGNAAEPPYPDESFDAVFFSYNGMQCIPGRRNRSAALHGIWRVLRRGGVYIFTAHNRGDPAFRDFWDAERVRWETGTQDPRLEMYGDLYGPDQTGQECFLHVSDTEEMLRFVSQEPFDVVEFARSGELADEPAAVRAFAGATVFWVLRKR